MAEGSNRLSGSRAPVTGAVRRACVYAALHGLTLLIADAWALARLRALHEQHGGTTSLLGMDVGIVTMRMLAIALLGLSLTLKMQCTFQAFRWAKLAEREAAMTGANPRLGGARGARITTVVCGLTSLDVIVVAYRLAN